ncbi:MAP kinase-activating death domain protein [Portunus trituberculatus]|uniref:MAP kinase-activating death domain protein n=1 Tax=Portunus trituberculatus TaxID=210409 RepID=A0A5B7DHI2_PORTR|nr:MAP kinase-activating death domain protein [Portunus trituberculatus]
MEASKQAQQASKSTFEDLSFMGKHTLGDFTKTAREAAKKGGIFSKVSLKVRGTTTVTGLCGTFPHLFLRAWE